MKTRVTKEEKGKGDRRIFPRSGELHPAAIAPGKTGLSSFPPVVDRRTTEQILGYDVLGIPRGGISR